MKEQKENKERKYPRKIKEVTAKAFLGKCSLRKVQFIYSSCHNQGCSTAGYIKTGNGCSSQSYKSYCEKKNKTSLLPITSHSSIAVLCNLYTLLTNGRCAYSISLQLTLTVKEQAALAY